MTSIALYQLAFLHLGVLMIAFGFIGILGIVNTQTILMAVVLIVVSLLSFHLGQIYSSSKSDNNGDHVG